VFFLGWWQIQKGQVKILPFLFLAILFLTHFVSVLLEVLRSTLWISYEDGDLTVQVIDVLHPGRANVSKVISCWNAVYFSMLLPAQHNRCSVLVLMQILTRIDQCKKSVYLVGVRARRVLTAPTISYQSSYFLCTELDCWVFVAWPTRLFQLFFCF
jgi:hypothetical protein